MPSGPTPTNLTYDPSEDPNKKYYNPSHGTGAYFEIVQESGGQWHVYNDGTKNFVSKETGIPPLQTYAQLHPTVAAPVVAPVVQTPVAQSSGPPPSTQQTQQFGTAGTSAGPPPLRDGPPKWESTPGTQVYYDTSGKEYEVQYSNAGGEYQVHKDNSYQWVQGNPNTMNMDLQQYNQYTASQQGLGVAPPNITSSTPVTGTVGGPPPDLHGEHLSWSTKAGTPVYYNDKGEKYEVQSPTANGEFHVYQDNGRVLWVQGAPNTIQHMDLQQYDQYLANNPTAKAPVTPGAVGSTAASSTTATTTTTTTTDTKPHPNGGATEDHLYKVENGDNLYGISQATGVPIYHLETLNKGKVPDFHNLKQGEEIDIGSAKVPSASEVLADSHPKAGNVASTGTSQGSSQQTYKAPYTPPGGVSSTPTSFHQSNTTSHTTDVVSKNTTSTQMHGGGNINSGSHQTAGSVSIAGVSPSVIHQIENGKGTMVTGPNGGPVTQYDPGNSGVPISIQEYNKIETQLAKSHAHGAAAAMGFPKSSSYPFTSTGEESANPAETIKAPDLGGWTTNNGGQAMDVAKSAFEIDTKPNTDPLKIDERK